MFFVEGIDMDVNLPGRTALVMEQALAAFPPNCFTPETKL